MMTNQGKRYMDLLNLKSREEAYQKVKELSSDLTDQQHTIRSCIFDLHAAVEIELRRIYYHVFKALLFLTDDEAENAKKIAELDRVVGRLGFMEMYRLLGPILNGWYADMESIAALNETRNRASHGDVDKVLYKGRSPFTDEDCFAQMFFDVWAIKQHMPKFFWHTIEKPIDRLRRYFAKYGDI